MLLTVVTCVVQMKIHCKICDSLQAHIDFCLLFCASKKLKQQAEIYHFHRIHTWVILTKIPSWQMIQRKVQEQTHYFFENESVLIHFCVRVMTNYFFCSASSSNKLNCTIWLERWFRCFQLEVIKILSTKLVLSSCNNVILVWKKIIAKHLIRHRPCNFWVGGRCYTKFIASSVTRYEKKRWYLIGVYVKCCVFFGGEG